MGGSRANLLALLEKEADRLIRIPDNIAYPDMQRQGEHGRSSISEEHYPKDSSSKEASSKEPSTFNRPSTVGAKCSYINLNDTDDDSDDNGDDDNDDDEDSDDDDDDNDSKDDDDGSNSDNDNIDLNSENVSDDDDSDNEGSGDDTNRVKTIRMTRKEKEDNCNNGKIEKKRRKIVCSLSGDTYPLSPVDMALRSRFGFTSFRPGQRWVWCVCLYGICTYDTP
jgi:hypothetical protein